MMQTDRGDCLFSGLNTAIGVIAGFLVFSLGLGLYGLQFQEASTEPQMLLAMFLSTWAGAIGLAAQTIISSCSISSIKKSPAKRRMQRSTEPTSL